MPNPSLPDFLTSVTNALKSGQFVRLQLAGYKGVDDSLKKIIIRQVMIKKQPHLSFTYQHKTRDITKNFPVEAGLHALSNALQNGFTVGTLFTTGFDLAWPSMKQNRATYTTAPALDHDRPKKRVIAPGGSWLHALGVTGADGSVLSASQDKYRQINKFVELVGPLFADIDAPRVVDMGSGKGYLTFALYDYLANTLNKHTHVTGIEDRGDLVSLCNDIAFASDFTGLTFEQGRIADYAASAIDVLIALHACDTATDDAITKGIKAQARAIVVAPCCHKQIRREMEKTQTADLGSLLRHGVFLERQAEMVTDALRALILEAQGYQVKVMEFISDAHTPKNVMIVATRAKKPRDRQKVDADIAALKSVFGIEKHYLESMLNDH